MSLVSLKIKTDFNIFNSKYLPQNNFEKTYFWVLAHVKLKNNSINFMHQKMFNEKFKFGIEIINS